MAIAAMFGTAGIAPSHVETGLAASVLVLGTVVALGLGMPASLAAIIVGVFAIFHGVAHGAEIPPTMAGLSYGAGFVAATALLHAAGVGAGLFARHLTANSYVLRAAGGLIATVGIMMVVTGTPV